MKYGESSFDVIYLLFAIVTGLWILHRRRDRVGLLMGSVVLILGCGDAFHLVPRVLNYFVTADFAPWLGVGKLVTSVTMTVFYLLMYRIWLKVYGVGEDRRMTAAVYALTAVRVLLCLFPQNRWLTNDGPLSWSVIRNVPFVLLGAIMVWLFFNAYSTS